MSSDNQENAKAICKITFILAQSIATIAKKENISDDINNFDIGNVMKKILQNGEFTAHINFEKGSLCNLTYLLSYKRPDQSFLM
jgi:hypothetical protein